MPRLVWAGQMGTLLFRCRPFVADLRSRMQRGNNSVSWMNHFVP